MKTSTIVTIIVIVIILIAGALVLKSKQAATGASGAGETALTADEQAALDNSTDSVDTSSLSDNSLSDLG